MSATEIALAPLKDAKVTVSEMPNMPGWYEVHIEVTPHFKYLGAHFTLSLVGKMDSNEKDEKD